MQHHNGENSMCPIMIPPSLSLILIFLEWGDSISWEFELYFHSNPMARHTHVPLFTGSPRLTRSQTLILGCGKWSLTLIWRGSLCTLLFILIWWYVQPTWLVSLMDQHYTHYCSGSVWFILHQQIHWSSHTRLHFSYSLLLVSGLSFTCYLSLN